MTDIKKYIQNMEVLGKCIFQIYNNDFSYEERHCMIKKTLEAYKESRLDLFPYDELADYFSQEICKYNGGLQDYTIDRLLVRFGCSFSVFILDEFREDIEHSAWDDVCKMVQMFFVVFAEVLRAVGRTDKIEQVPNVSYMKTMMEELKIEKAPQTEEHLPGNKEPKTERNVDEEIVGSWFKATFKGAGRNINHLPDLITELQQTRSNKDFAKIAFLIYNCKDSLVYSNTFSEFYSDFCRAVGCEQKQYDPCKLKDEEFARKFPYLQ